ncbi:hypothetical protein CEE37_06045 [candidate division LCP-89 bacterium B3_LCP]|uniref:Secretion system C-terminal sorting domain-containing protein n=1 Tax=candidate division LCP-89 bacterium B3_LCP TaxID=2012998 RepID=A0A532V1W9_UNCL8|nr:MAG: hypothetical protein CEE37_06045 [candidate division LCP-89 bacterium B3_LCP]
MFGGGIYADSCSVHLVNNTISQNVSEVMEPESRGGGIFAKPTADYYGENNIIYDNDAFGDPEYSGTAALNYSCCATTLSGTDNITDDPLFVDPSVDDFNLQELSPCIDTGDPLSPYDPDGTRVDMGALYYDQSAGVIISQIDHPFEFRLEPAYPNPFNPVTNIAFSLPIAGDVILGVYNIQGSQVATLLDEWQNAGRHDVTFVANNLSSGLYIVRLQAGEFHTSQKIVLMK